MDLIENLEREAITLLYAAADCRNQDLAAELQRLAWAAFGLAMGLRLRIN